MEVLFAFAAAAAVVVVLFCDDTLARRKTGPNHIKLIKLVRL